MAQATPNIDKLEALFAALPGDSPSISCQPSTMRPGELLWSVSCRNDGFWYGSGATLAAALDNLSLVQTADAKPTLADLEKAAA